jgi:hypothetical protein
MLPSHAAGSQIVSAPAAKIDAWIKEVTKGAIPEILGGPGAKSSLVALNALHFKSRSKSPFDPALTAPAVFVGVDGKNGKVAMMPAKPMPSSSSGSPAGRWAAPRLISPCRASSLARTGKDSPIPNLAPLPLYRNAGGIADLDPDRTSTGSIGAIDLLRHDALDANARMSEHGRPILGDVFVNQDVTLSIEQQPRQRGLAFMKRVIAQIVAIMLDQVEGVEDRGSSGLPTGQLLEP